MVAHWIFFVGTWLFLECKIVVAQVTVQNPLIWQTLVSPYSSNNFDYVSDSTSKYYSQDFQTVLAYKDNNGQNERLLIYAGDGCHDLTNTELSNYNNGLNSFVKRQPVMGLVSRGGGCSWSTKINTIKTFVRNNNNVQMTGVLLYDNVTYESTALVRLLPSQQLSSTYWNMTTLTPSQRNISHIVDNDLITPSGGDTNGSSNSMAIYFVPFAFAQDMLGKMNNTNSHYVMLAPYFTDIVMDDNPSNTNAGGGQGGATASSDDNGAGMDNLFGYGNRGYIAYLIAAGVAILLAIVLFRWCRNPRFGLARYRQRSSSDPEQQQQVPLGPFPPHHHQQPPPLPCVPIEKLDAMCAAQPASLVLTQMKNTVCAICLDDFKSSSIVRLLPCHHGFCVACIDFWLTKKSSLCPICKYDCAVTLDDDEDDIGKMHTITTITPPPPPSSSSSFRPSASSTLPGATALDSTTPTTTILLGLAEHDLGTNTPSPPPPPYVQSQQSTTAPITPPSSLPEPSSRIETHS